jgi:hypothetical protein
MKQTYDRYIDMRMLEYVSRPQYKYGCSIAALTAVINYLYAEQLGIKTSEELATALGWEIDDIGTKVKPNNDRVMHWFNYLLSEFGLKGSCSIYLKNEDVADFSINSVVFTKFKSALK